MIPFVLATLTRHKTAKLLGNVFYLDFEPGARKGVNGGGFVFIMCYTFCCKECEKFSNLLAFWEIMGYFSIF